MAKRTSVLIEKLVTACGGDVHSALRALLAVNEELERENRLLEAVLAGHGTTQQAYRSLH